MLKTKPVFLILAVLLVITGLGAGSANTKVYEKREIVNLAPGYPNIKAKGAVLIDAASGQVLYGLNMNDPLPPASTTKIMTGILAIERSNLNDQVTVSEAAPKEDGTRIGLAAGETMTMKDLIYAMMLSSANDAAVAIAEHMAGSKEKFARLMNAKARELGAKNTNFANPNGLPDPNHYTSAYDLALIARYAMQNSVFRQVVGTVSYQIKRENPDAQKYLQNHNRMLWSWFYKYPGVTGIKTGYTIAAQQCIVSSAKRDGREYIAVVLNTNASFEYARELLDFGFNKFVSKNVIQSGEFVKNVDVKYGTDKVNLMAKSSFNVSLPQGEQRLPEARVIVDSNITAPIKAGQKMGRIDYYYRDSKVGSVDLVAQKSVSRKLVSKKSTWGLLAGLVGGSLLLFFMAGVRSKYLRKRSRKLQKVNRIWVNRRN